MFKGKVYNHSHRVPDEKQTLASFIPSIQKYPPTPPNNEPQKNIQSGFAGNAEVHILWLL